MNSTIPDPRPGAGESGPAGKTSQTVIRINPACRLLPQLSADAFRNIQGVQEVITDASCKTIRIIFDGMQETKNRLSAYLSSCERKPRCGADKTCGRGAAAPAEAKGAAHSNK